MADYGTCGWCDTEAVAVVDDNPACAEHMQDAMAVVGKRLQMVRDAAARAVENRGE